ncbi:unnamed protein product [Callosobruchus maculatus]|uniref:EB domain-containing protein n=1 Tax=Callosobruchus maculatus TaxID=64391 RepID=A0A653D0S2_CALMS|nr:unnamed protein product [Callosobruchus maculatus]
MDIHRLQIPGPRGNKKFGDKCTQSIECGFGGSICDSLSRTCICNASVPVTNHLDKCGTLIQTSYTPERYIDPTMIGILVAMFLMFITICVVLRLFSK